MEFKKDKVAFQEKDKFADDMKRFAVDEAARFTTDGNEAASASVDEAAEHLVRLSSEKNKSAVEEKKQILAEIKEKKKELSKEKSINPSRKNVSVSSYSSQGEHSRFSSGSRSVENSGNFVDKEATKGFSSGEESRFSSETKMDRETQKKNLDKKQDTAKKEKAKEQKKAATKSSVATMLRAKKDMSNDLASDKSTGNALRDGISGLMKTFVDLMNPIRMVKSLLAKLGILVAPYIAIFMVVATIIMIIVMFIFSILQPIAEVGDAIGSFLSVFSVETETFRNTELSEDEINDILEDSGADEVQEKVIRFALSKVGYPYSQAQRTSGSAYDCSSLAYYAWNDAGVDISFGTGYPPTASEGARVLKEKEKALTTMDLKPGDLVYYGGSSNGRYMGIYHVAIYVGGGKCVEALNERYGVVYQTLRTNNAIMVCRPNK